jgi:hypothetical protein
VESNICIFAFLFRKKKKEESKFELLDKTTKTCHRKEEYKKL